MKFLTTPGWKGYSKKQGRQGQTELLSYDDMLANTTQQTHDKSIAGAVTLDHVSWTCPEDASIPAIKQKLIDLELIPEVKIEDIKADKGGTVERRLTMTNVSIVGVHVSIDDQGGGVATVTARCSKAKWERRTPDGTYAEAVWNPNGM
jgi:type VI protein secretion system component Hcp